MKQATVDDKKRIVLPKITPGALVTIEQPDADTWIVRRHSKAVRLKQVLIPIIDTLPHDPEWDKVENAFAKAAYKKLRRKPPPFN